MMEMVAVGVVTGAGVRAGDTGVEARVGVVGAGDGAGGVVAKIDVGADVGAYVGVAIVASAG